MILGKHINRYYLKYAGWLILGLLALVLVDALQLVIPKLYRVVVDGMSGVTQVEALSGELMTFDLNFVMDWVCMPMVGIILCMVFGRFLWRICFFGSAVRLEEDLRNRMFSHAKELSREYYQVNKVGDLMSLFTNDLDTVQECFGWGVMMLFDALLLGILAVISMWTMDPLLTVLSMIPMAFLLASATVVGKYMMKKWDIRQEAFSRLSDFSQESFSGIAVIKAFVKEAKELWAFKQLNEENEKANMDALPHFGDTVRGKRHLHHPGLRRLFGVQGQLHRRPVAGIHRLFQRGDLAHHGRLRAHRYVQPWHRFPEAHRPAAGCGDPCEGRPGRSRAGKRSGLH